MEMANKVWEYCSPRSHQGNTNGNNSEVLPTPVKMFSLKKKIMVANTGKDVKRIESLPSASGNTTGAASVEGVCRLLKHQSITACDPAMSLLHIQPEDSKSRDKDTCAFMLIAVLVK